MPKRSVSNSASKSPQRPTRSPQRNSSPQRQRRSPPRDQEEVKEPKVYVSGLPPNIQKDEINQLFSKYGQICDLFVVNKDSFSFAFVLYADIDAANQAINEMSGHNVKGKRIKCELARPRPQGGNRQGGGQRGGNFGDRPKGCFKCGQEGHFARECPNPDEGNNNRGRRDNNNGEYRPQNDRFKNNNRSPDRRGSPQKRGPTRKKSVSRSTSPVKQRGQARKRSHSRSSSSKNQKRRESPKKRQNKHSRSRSAELRKGRKRPSPSSSFSSR